MFIGPLKGPRSNIETERWEISAGIELGISWTRPEVFDVAAAASKLLRSTRNFVESCVTSCRPSWGQKKIDPGLTRTDNLQIWSLTHYQLCYGTVGSLERTRETTSEVGSVTVYRNFRNIYPRFDTHA